MRVSALGLIRALIPMWRVLGSAPVLGHLADHPKADFPKRTRLDDSHRPVLRSAILGMIPAVLGKPCPEFDEVRAP